MGVGVAVFLIGSPRYTKVPPEVDLHFMFFIIHICCNGIYS